MFRILHERKSSDLHVVLWWDSKTDRVRVSVRDRGTGEGFVVIPEPADALEAFYHPYSFRAAPEVDDLLAA
jgi:hypothetical protein